MTCLPRYAAPSKRSPRHFRILEKEIPAASRGVASSAVQESILCSAVLPPSGAGWFAPGRDGEGPPPFCLREG